jgi:hypothetical protein
MGSAWASWVGVEEVCGGAAHFFENWAEIDEIGRADGVGGKKGVGMRIAAEDRFSAGTKWKRFRAKTLGLNENGD